MSDSSRFNMEKRRGSSSSMSEYDDPFQEMSDIYGQTPPRSRLNRKQREKKQRDETPKKTSTQKQREETPRKSRERKNRNWSEARQSSANEVTDQATLCRQNTTEMIFNKMFERVDENQKMETTDTSIKDGNRHRKRSMKMCRGSERDLKLDIDAAAHYAECCPQPKSNTRKIESKKKFLCLLSERVDPDRTRIQESQEEPNAPSFQIDEEEEVRYDDYEDRKRFHDAFSQLVRLGSKDKERNCDRQISTEESRWKNELKDLIWLELQAYHADRTLVAQDEYLFEQRKSIESLLIEIMKYKYEPASCFIQASSGPTISNDSGFDGSTMNPSDSCEGCLSMYCVSCTRCQLTALKQVDCLLSRLEAAEALYPSSQAFATYYPLYKSPEFTNRVKSMCLWYNITRHHRLKLRILGRLLTITEKAKSYSEVDFGMSSGSLNMNESAEPRQAQVKFEILQCDSQNTTPSDSNNSNNSNYSTFSNSGILLQTPSLPTTPETSIFSMDDNKMDRFFRDFQLMEFDRQTYRKYIEEVLKTRGLRRSLNFLERLHNTLLRKASLSLEKFEDFEKTIPTNPTDDIEAGNNSAKNNSSEENLSENNSIDEKSAENSNFFGNNSSEVNPTENYSTESKTADTNSTKNNPEEVDEIEEYDPDMELRRYGVWSPEAQSLNLPSYRTLFLFLSRVPLDMIHEFLRMRLEQKPESPGPLSVRQLMREMREGLRIACVHRDRFVAHSETAMIVQSKKSNESLDTLITFDLDLEEFDGSLKSVFEVYLEYLEQWVEMVHYNSLHKNLIDDEWSFVKSIAGKIKDGYEIAGIKFCRIASIVIQQINEFLIIRPQEIRQSEELIDNQDLDIRFQYMSLGRTWQRLFVEAREKINKGLCLSKSLGRDIYNWPYESDALKEAIENLRNVVLSLRKTITILIQKFIVKLKEIEEPKSEGDRSAMRTRIREILHQAFRMGFDYYNVVFKFFLPRERKKLARGMMDFAMLWNDFVINRCEKGRGLRPRWASHGLEYLSIACDVSNTRHLTDIEFQELQESMDLCITHVIGDVQTPGSSGSYCEQDPLKRLPKSRTTSPSRSSIASKSRENLKSLETAFNQRKSSSLSVVDGNLAVLSPIEDDRNWARRERVLAAVRNFDNEIDKKRRSQELIGRITDKRKVDNIKIKMKKVTFTWQRGIKIGQGRFGKVYTVVCNQSGELLAMKEVALQPGDHRAIRRVVEELQIFEGIKHKHLVRYYGIEIQREEMLIFMEFCAEGTLESLVAGSGNGLPEIFVRKYTSQLLLAVSVLHSQGVVHRDIKTANIFLTDQGNCLKLGDFGSAVQIKAHTTMPGELQGFVGTQAYMAPEVFMKTETVGHGRAADIWSVGCCVIEMASGIRPWAEFDSNYQIMFKVGMGETPEPPDNLCREGVDFTEKCLQHDPKKRSTAEHLLSHPFAINYDDANSDLLTRVGV